MAKISDKNRRLNQRKWRLRGHITGTTERPRLTVRRSLKHIYAQVIDDTSGQTLAAASSVGLKVKGSDTEGAKAVGKALAEQAKAASVEHVAFDRAGRLYHGRVKALADAAREGGLRF
jgi:large subunit ribosomal protein L18